MAKLGVVVDKSQTGVTEGDDFTIDITEVTDKSVTATVTPKDASIYYYVSAYDAETFDEKGEAAVVAELKAMFDFYVQYGMWDYYKETLMSKGTATYTTPEATPLTAGASYYLIAFGLEENSEGTALIPNTAVMKVPFKTTTPVVVNTKYRVTVDNITWYGAGYSVVPSDDLHYFHGIVKKSAFTGGQGQPLTDAEVAAAYVKEYETRYYDELYMDDPTTIKWTDLSSCGTQRQVVPRAWIRENELANEAIRPLVAETDYCLIAFGVIIFISGWDRCASKIASGQVTTALAIPDWIYNAFIPLGAFLMVIHTVERILDGIGELKTLHGADKPEGGDAA